MTYELDNLYNKDLKKIEKVYKTNDDEFLFKILITSWFLQRDNESLLNLEKFIINKEKTAIKAIDVVFLDKGVLHLIKINKKNNVETFYKDYKEAKFAAYEIWTTLDNPYLTKKEKFNKTGVNQEIIESIESLDFSVSSNFFMVIDKSSKEDQEDLLATLSEQEQKEVFTPFDVIKYSLKNINNGIKSQKKQVHKLKIEPKDLISHKAYDVNSMILKIQIREIMEMVAKEKRVNTLDSLFDGNIRFVVKKATISKEIKQSLIDETENFFFLNNGLSIIVDNLKLDKNRYSNFLEFENPVIVNGQQTIRTLDNYFVENPLDQCFDNAYILCRFYDLTNNKDLANRIPYTSNNQNKVGKNDLVVLCEFHNKIKNILMENDIFYRYKAGKSNFDKWSKILPYEISYDNLAKTLSLNLDNVISIKNKKNLMHSRIWESLYLSNNENENDLESLKLIKRLNEEKNIDQKDKDFITKSALIFVLLEKKKQKLTDLGWGPSFDSVYYVIFKLFEKESVDFIFENIDVCFNHIIDLLTNYFDRLFINEGLNEKGYLFKQEKSWNQFKFFTSQISNDFPYETKLNNLTFIFRNFLNSENIPSISVNNN